MKGTRRDVLLQLEEWLEDKQAPRVFWLNGLVGSGKSAIAQTFAEICFADGTLGASFFCSREFDDRSNGRLILPTLAFQLAHRYPQFREELLKLLRTNPDVGQESLDSQMEKLIVGPFVATQIRTLIVIDALDECKDQGLYSPILVVHSKHVERIPNAKFFITAGPGRTRSSMDSACRRSTVSEKCSSLTRWNVPWWTVISSDFYGLDWRTSPGEATLTSQTCGHTRTVSSQKTGRVSATSMFSASGLKDVSAMPRRSSNLLVPGSTIPPRCLTSFSPSSAMTAR